MKPLIPTLALLSLTFFALQCAAPPPAIDPQGNVQIRNTSSNIRSQGLSLFETYKKQKKISSNPAYNSQLQRVATKIRSVVNLPNAQWEFVVFEDKTPNAFALPGGKVGVNSGLFQISNSDAALATVVSHEIAHVTSNHAEARIQQNQSVDLGSAILDAVLASRGATQDARALASAAPKVAFSLPFSRAQELEADRIGMIFMAKAGYDPAQALSLWKNFASYNQSQGGQGAEFLRTHPLDSTRLNALQSFLPVAKNHYRP